MSRVLAVPIVRLVYRAFNAVRTRKRINVISRAVLLAPCFGLLAACHDGTDTPLAVDQISEQPPPGQKSIVQTSMPPGYEIYAEFCASCHDTGLDGAPVTGNPADGEDRSQLWSAVLTEHAKAGYLEMPAKGGESTLSDLTVSNAVEHMMLTTFPEKLPD